MAEYIEREAAIEKGFFYMLPNGDTSPLVVFASDIKKLPAADVRPVVRGKWEYFFRDDDGLEIVECICSACHDYKESYARWLYDDGNRNWFNFCPNCGADMREADDEKA